MQPTDVLLLVTEALEALGSSYCVGGSFASSTYGEPRATRDIDILVVLPLTKAQSFAAQVEPHFFAQLSEIRDAIARAPSLRDDPAHRATCNLVHRTSFFRIDLFVSSGRPFERMQLERRMLQTVTVNPERHAFFASPEDVILNKLEWYWLSQGVLDRQWSDVRAVIATQGTTLDLAYVRDWAAQIGVAHLLEAALRGDAPPKPVVAEEHSQLRMDI